MNKTFNKKQVLIPVIIVLMATMLMVSFVNAIPGITTTWVNAVDNSRLLAKLSFS